MKKQIPLKTLKECEYPEEFLVARLQGKKGGLFRNWEFLVSNNDVAESLQNTPFYPYLKQYAAPGIWRFLYNEHLWIYARMNPSLRAKFTPYFIYHEINTLLVCLRDLNGRKGIESVLQQLHNSLLHEKIQKILTNNSDFNEVLEKLEFFLCSRSEHFQGLHKYFEDMGFQALELFLRNQFLEYIFHQVREPVLNTFFQDIIDFHNCMALAKNLRWQMESEPPLFAGGTIPADRFKRAFFRKDMALLLKGFHLQDQEEATNSTSELETALLHSITIKLKRRSSQGSVVGDILFYLWEQFRYCRNISMILNTLSVDDDLVRERIVV